MDIVRELTSGAVLEDEEVWEFDATRAVATPEKKCAEWNEKDGPKGFHKEAMGHL